MSGPLPGRPWGTEVVLGLVAVAIAHFATAVAFGHSVASALETLAEDMVMLVVVASVVAVVRSRKRRRRAQEG
ncbi:hypothetical protein [Streptomyces hokutonensis]|uniref:hypothetical protein n=1 Tax=Streptomyces hokutonensis TaxID=1306990 RepID=UPI00367E706B